MVRHQLVLIAGADRSLRIGPPQITALGHQMLEAGRSARLGDQRDPTQLIGRLLALRMVRDLVP